MAASPEAARRMMFSNSAGSVMRPLVATGKVCLTGPSVGEEPMRPAENCSFCAATALFTSSTVMPSRAMRSGRSQMRMA
ncbi:hypothetical protein D3C87_1309880 [compost metagenome]|nr:hypothetical protein LMG19282_04714 [Cupriavidus campinensis]